MDVFVHDNFFPEQHHVAFVYDPLAGSEAFFHRTGGGLEPVPRYWLGGRERRPATRLPEAAPEQPASGADGQGTTQLERAARALQALAESRSSATSALPWAVALGALLLLFFDGRGAPPWAARGRQGGAIVILERDPISGRAAGIPVEALEAVEGGRAYRDVEGNTRLGLELRGADGAPLLQPGLARQPRSRRAEPKPSSPTSSSGPRPPSRDRALHAASARLGRRRLGARRGAPPGRLVPPHPPPLTEPHGNPEDPDRRGRGSRPAGGRSPRAAGLLRHGRRACPGPGPEGLTPLPPLVRADDRRSAGRPGGLGRHRAVLR